ncbi:MAG: MFS transporter [Bacillota bacterium]
MQSDAGAVPEIKPLIPRDLAVRARNLLVAAHALQHVISTSLPPLLIFIRQDLGLSGVELGFIVAAANVSSSLFQYPAGILTDKFGPKRILLVGYCLTLSGIFLLSRASSMPAFILAQMVYGMGNSTFHPASFADVGRAMEGRGVGMGMAMHNIGGNVGTAAGYSISALLATALGWRNALVTLVGAGVILVILFAVYYPDLWHIMGQIKAEKMREREANGEGSEEVGAPMEPLTWRDWIPAYVVAIAALLSGIFGTGLMAWFPTFFESTRDVTATVAAGFSSIMMISGVGGSFTGGTLADRLDRPTIIFVATLAASALLMVIINVPMGSSVLIVLLIGMGFFHSTARPVLNAITNQVSPPGKSGSVFGLVFGMMALGGVISGPMVGYLYDRYSMEVAFMALSVFYVLHALLIRAWGSARLERRESWGSE